MLGGIELAVGLSKDAGTRVLQVVLTSNLLFRDD